MTGLLAAAAPYLVQYGIPAAAYAIGHLVGWLHRKHTHPAAAQPAAGAAPAAQK